MQTYAIEIEKKTESGYFNFYYNIWRLIDKITKQWETYKNQTRKRTKSLILRKVLLQLLKKKKAYTMDTYRNLTKKKNKTNELPINGTHSCYIYIYCGRLYSLALTPLKHQQHFYYINKKIWKKRVLIKVEVHWVLI